MEKLDRRIRRTHQLLGDALIALALERDYDSVTIKDITERADVAYVTFFRHYRDKDELLRHRLQAIMDDIEMWSHEDFRQSEGIKIFTFVQGKADIFRMLFKNHHTRYLVKQIQDRFAQQLAARCAPLYAHSQIVVPSEIVANHLAVSIFGLVEWWLDHDMAYPPEAMAQMYDTLIRTPLEA
jgi:AcrR family transcriptional regulator